MKTIWQTFWIALKPSNVDSETLDLSVKNPNKNDEVVYRTPEEIIAEMVELDKQSAEILAKIKELV